MYINSIVRDIVREKLKQPEQTERMITIEKEQVEPQMSRVPKKPDFVTISIYAVLAVFVIYFSAALGACFDCALDENGKADFDKLASSLESTLMNTDLVFELVRSGGKAMQFPIFTAFWL